MIFNILHKLVNLSSSYFTEQNRNLFVFVTGTILYVLLYATIGSLVHINKFYFVLFNTFWYIIVADIIAIAIIYKNYYGKPIINEVTNICTKNNVCVAEPIETDAIILDSSQII